LRKRGLDHPARILSICLDAQPEIAAVLGRRPITVTGGATPLEGLPGETTMVPTSTTELISRRAVCSPTTVAGPRNGGGAL